MRMTGKLLIATAALVALSGTAMAADLYVPPAAPAPVAAAAPTNWDGLYIGGNVGYGWGLADHTSGPGTNDINMSGFMLGAQIGYNFHLSDQVVAGIEGNVDWSNETGSIPVFGTTTHAINWEGAVVGKLGLDLGTVMPYIDAGVAFANATRSNTGVPASATQSQTGWTAGVGVEMMLADNLSAFVSYNYNDYGSTTYNTGGTPPTIHLTDNVVKVGLNYHF